MDIFSTNVPCVQLTVICVIVLDVIGASNNISWNSRLMGSGVPLVSVGHVINEQTRVRQHGHTHAGSSCQDAVTQLTDAVSQYADCVSVNALNSSVCESCVDYYLNAAAALVAADSSVYFTVSVCCSYASALAVVVIKLHEMCSHIVSILASTAWLLWLAMNHTGAYRTVLDH